TVFVYAIFLAVFIGLILYSDFASVSSSFAILIFRSYFLIEYIILALFISYLYQHKNAKRILLFSIIPFVAFCIYNYTISAKDAYDKLPTIVEFICFILFIVYYFYERMVNITSNAYTAKISYRLIIGLFIYFTGTLFFYLMANSADNQTTRNTMRIVAFTINIIKDTILSLAWLGTEKDETDKDLIHVPDNLGLDDDLPFNNPTTTLH
ncbi:MAG: hypothetical protein ABL929_12935, partial [Ferruginibacter sp.]